MLTIKTGICPYAKNISHNLDFNTGGGTRHKHEPWEFKPSRTATWDISHSMLYLRNQEKTAWKRAVRSTPTNLTQHSAGEQNPKYSKRLSSP